MTHQQPNHPARKAGFVGAALLSLGLLAPIAAQADHDDRTRISVHFGTSPVTHYQHVRHNDHRYHRGYDRRFDGRRGGYSAYFVRPNRPLNFKHWRRVERRLHEYTPPLRHLNRYEARQVLSHGYDRYLRDHRRWSKRMNRRAARSYYREYDHDHRYCNDRSHRHPRHRRW